MYKVLIIDDEEPLREAIRILGDWKGLGVDKVLEATNGRSGLDLLEEEPIDIVMVDMKMPEVNGVEFLQLVERNYSDISTIVISGYNDFQYTRQAIHSKAVDYLLKPVNRNELNQALRKAIEMIEARRKSKDEHISKSIALNMSLPKLKEKVYQSIIDGSFTTWNNQTFLPLIGADDPDNRYGCAVIRILNMEEVRTARFRQDRQLLYFAVANIVDEMSKDYMQCFSFASPKQEREIITIFTLKGEYSEELVFEMDLLVKRVSNTLKDLLGMKTVIGVGEACSDTMEMSKVYESAKSAMRNVNLLKLKGSAVAYKSDVSDRKEPPSIMGRLSLIRSSFEAGNLAQARSVVSEFLKSVHVSGTLHLGDTDWMMREYIFLLNEIAQTLGVTASLLPQNSDVERTLGVSMDFADMEQLEKLMIQLIEVYGERIRRAASGQRPFDAEDIKEYIDHHYYEDFKISMFTEKYFLSREYLMKRFKQQYGFGIHEYAQKVRMDKAKELLGDPNLKIQEISEMLGYRDKNYFSKAFKNYYLMSPSEYRITLK